MHFGNKNILIKTNEVMDVPPIQFNVPAAYIQTVGADQVATGKGSFKDFYKSNVPSFNADSMFIHKAAEYVKSNEGVRNKLYKDSKGKWTIGIGHLVTPDEFEMYRGKVLSDGEVEALFAKDISSKLMHIKQYFGSAYDSFPENVKIAIIDGYFRGDLSGSPETKRLLKAGLFKQAAQEYLNNKEYKAAVASGSGVAKRMQRNAAAFKRAI
jgi:GH24 family phage-related lysozyme (muramidase)